MATSKKNTRAMLEAIRIVSIAGFENHSFSLTELQEVLTAAPNISDLGLAECIRAIDPSTDEASNNSVGMLIECIQEIEPLILEVGRVEAIRNFNAALNGLERLKGMSIEAFVSRLRQQLSKPTAANDQSPASIEDYVQVLSSSIHDSEQFSKAFEKLKLDKAMRQAEVARIAALVAYPMGKTTKRGVALERIWKLHEQSQTLSAKIDAQRGKSAA